MNSTNCCCRYCSNAVGVEDDIIACSVKQHTYSRDFALRYKKCQSFQFNELDVFDITKKYKAREKTISDINQISLWEVNTIDTSRT